MTSPGSSKNLKPAATTGTPRRTQEERSEDTRNRLLNATIDVVLKKGYSGFRMADAAAAASVSRGAQIHHYPTKDALIEAAIAKVFDSELSASKAAAATTKNSDILKDAATHAAEFLNSDEYYLTLNMLISAVDSPHIVGKIRTISTRNRDPIEKAWIDRLQQVGISSEEAEDVLWILWSVMRDVAVRERFCNDPGRNDRVIALALDMLSEYVNELARS